MILRFGCPTHLYPLRKVGRHVEAGRHDDIQCVDDNRDNPFGRAAKKRRQEGTFATEKHIILPRRIVDNVRRDRHNQRKYTGKQGIPNTIHARETMIARPQHRQGGVDKHRVIEHRMEADKGYNRIAIERRHRVNKVDRTP